MKKLILFLVLIFTTLNVYAKWVFIGSVNDVMTYVDTESYKKTGSTVRFWELYNFNEPQSINENSQLYLSYKLKAEVNCNTEESSTLALVYYSENDGKGKVINSFHYNDKEYTHIVPDTLGYSIYKFVCKKK